MLQLLISSNIVVLGKKSTLGGLHLKPEKERCISGYLKNEIAKIVIMEHLFLSGTGLAKQITFLGLVPNASLMGTTSQS